MSAPVSPESAEPLERGPAGHALFVPVRPGPTGCTTRFFRNALGGRTAVAFTSERTLVMALGPAQRWTRLSEPALRALAAPLGITEVRVDPRLSAPAPHPGPVVPEPPRRLLVG
ncbi:SAV_915 family protein [Streptomyces sp. NBC_01477]|uniref:SAV_915 family protein n=1 Tax=Streptomyces sp. NBC_01477 TaxID=2976015 RepID=UPI002E316160|nr:SAV_915 family protein [Streptomyces sp. NBC_01477]